MAQTVRPAHPGNTIPDGLPDKSRCWFITSFDEADRDQVVPKTTYDLRCDDTSKDGKWHCHIVIYFKNRISFNTIRKAFNGTAHIDRPRNVYDCIHYIKDNKNGRKSIYREDGTEPVDTRYKTVADLKACTDPDTLDWKQYNTWQKIHQDDEIDIEDWHKDVEVYYISGESGTGKTERAKQIVRDNAAKYGTKVSIVKFDGNFWHNVKSGGSIAIYDDFRDSHMKASEFINFIDYNRQHMNIKGGDVTNDYRLIIITSVQPLTSIYLGMPAEPRKQWMRRVTEIRLDSNDDAIEADWG